MNRAGRSTSTTNPKHKVDRNSNFNRNTMKRPETTPKGDTAVIDGEENNKPSKPDNKMRLNRKARLIIRNISFKATEDLLKKHYGPYGDIIEAKLLKRPDGKLVGCGFVHFKNVPMAEKALSDTNLKPFLGRPISVDWAVAKNKYMQHTINRQIEMENEVKKEDSDSDGDVNSDPLNINDEVKAEVKSESESDDEVKVKSEDGSDSGSEEEDSSDDEEDVDDDEEEDDDDEEQDEQEDDDNQSQTSTQPERQRLGDGNAELQAVEPTPGPSGIPLRPTSLVDQLKVYKKAKLLDAKNKKKLTDDQKKELARLQAIKQVGNFKMPDAAEPQRGKGKGKGKGRGSEDWRVWMPCPLLPGVPTVTPPRIPQSWELQRQRSNDITEELDICPPLPTAVPFARTPSRANIKLNDAEDGCTVFITNIPFDIDNDQLKQFAERTGPVKYALVCMDKLTEHSKGSGFVKFLNKEDTDKFTSLPKEQLKIDGQSLLVKPALKRENVQKATKKEAKDNRNLYLVKEGVVVAGTAAAVGVSASDMAKRLALERSKTQMLRNLNRFMSRYRLVVSNLPGNYDDAKLRQLCFGTGRKATITEARVMRDLRAPMGRDGKHPSKGYGFVMFTKHEDALACLRKLNNNPEIFDKNNRPIVSFSIEDRTALNARKKRLEKSIANNPLAKKDGELSNNKNNRKRKMKFVPDESYTKKGRFDNKNNKPNDIGKFGGKRPNNEEGEYVGLTAKEGSQHKMRNNHKLRAQADIHRQNVKQEKKQSKQALRLKMAAKERIKLPKQKINKNKTGKRRRFKRDKSAL